MAANLCVATPVQVAVARDKPTEKETSSDDRFSNMLSQRQTREDSPPAQRASTPKSKTSDPAKTKEAKPHDTLHLLQNSAAIQATVTPPVPTDQSPQATAESVDDVLSKSAAKAGAQPSLVGLAAQTNDAAVTTDTTTTTDAALKALTQPMIPALAGTTPAAGAVALTKTMAPVAATALANKPGAVATRAFVPSDVTADASDVIAQTADTVAEARTSTTPTPPNDVAPIAIEAGKPATSPVAQQPAIVTTQPDFSNAAPAIVATAIAATVTHRTFVHDDTPDDSLDSIDATIPAGATATLSLPEQRDIATVDGKIPVPAPSSPQFGDVLGAKLTWMAERHIGHAEIRLSPDDLGTLDVRVRLNGEHVRAEFASANSDVRQAINDHLPRLREMLSQHGFNLAESHVGHGSNQQTAQTAPDDATTSHAEDERALPAPRVSAYTHDGILDAFA